MADFCAAVDSISSLAKTAMLGCSHEIAEMTKFDWFGMLRHSLHYLAMASVWTKSVSRLAISIVQDLDITWYRSGLRCQLLIGPDTIDNAVRPSIARPCTDDLLGDHVDLLYAAVLDLLDDRWRIMRQDQIRNMTSITASVASLTLPTCFP